MKCAIYARVSTDEQAKKYSIPAQLDLLRSFAQINNHEIFKEYNNHTNILEIFRFESPEGYMIIRRSGKNFAIDIYGDSPIELTTEIKEILVPYFKGDLLMSLDKNQNDCKLLSLYRL